ncbi:MAG: hypothetical protein WC966_03505 [Bradymonadales bacterium]|jgi:hypothetical protein
MRRYFAFLIILAFLGTACANAVNDGERPIDGNGGNGENSGGEGSGGEETQVECTLLGTLKCDDEKKRVKCVENKWVAYDSCDHECDNGECVSLAQTVSCENPMPLALNTVVEGSTATRSQSVTATGVCHAAAPSAGNEMIYRVEIPKLAIYEITLDTGGENAGYALYLQKKCAELTSIIKDSCMYSYVAGAKTTALLLNPGTYFLIVDSPSEDKVTDFNLVLRESSVSELKLCLQGKNVNGGLIDLSEPKTITASIKDGLSAMNWDVRAGCKSIGNAGKEMVYTFRLDQAQTFKAELSMSPVDAETEQNTLVGALYLMRCGTDSSVMTVCADTRAGEALSIHKELDAGLYSLVVDSVASSEKQEFSFTLKLSAQ